MKSVNFTGIANDDRRIAEELQAMGASDKPDVVKSSVLAEMLEPVSQFLTWMRWKGECGVYGCRVGAAAAYTMETRRL